MSNVFILLALAIDKILWIYSIVIIVRALMSWFRPNPDNALVRFIYGITDPVLNPVRDLLIYRLGLNLGGLDISPLIVLVAIHFFRIIAVDLLKQLAEAFA
jgi:YggT family protein